MQLVFRVASVLFVLVSPLVIYVAVTRLSIAHGALVVGAWIAARAIPKLATTPRAHLKAALQLPAIGIGCALLGAIVHDRRLLLALPSLLQFTMAGVFLRSLRPAAMPMVEHFARMQDPDLSLEKMAYCRSVTKVWVVFLATCGICGLVLGARGSAQIWALFTGGGSYVLVGLLFAGEYVVRQIRFRTDATNWMQRAFIRMMPERVSLTHGRSQGRSPGRSGAQP